ncbi:Intracellular exo-alpha-(1-_5)-L-arabinofuranosidase [Paenibacillus konkukensis]|uniref:non-reducing end alpha-L-arabinofuranosidase n=1 Tax=Paenibacillus konkukensis TaxID=2020716 RepID=A0ABY4RNT9_9BACL|nr:alpha-L-arabinofuranosidase C-terminal domain-containing protein [Paenibacillus konkukensis]UQZ83635.1 Intracellular exo-alpha-(1->5)-L-arabinofuranosidase [Paenibacillus konkukensis]
MMVNVQNARLTIGRDIADHCIHPYIFGHFIEDIDDHMPAMLAYPLTNMDFEEEDHNLDGVSGPWYPLNFGKHTQYALEPPARFHSGHSQKIRIFNKDRCASGIGQRMQVDGSIPYAVRMYVRATRELNAVHLKLVDRANGDMLGELELEVNSHSWKEVTGRITASRSCAAAELQVWAVPLPPAAWADSTSTGVIWFDHISLLPEGQTGLLKREVFEMAKALNGGILRLGGNYISLYHWEEFVGPVYLRPNYVNEAWEQAGQVHKYFGTDEFVDLCRQLAAEPQICVNMGTGTAEEAARWVEYCNGDASTPMGALRASHGHPEPYRVKYWEVGNEMYGPWQAGVCSAETYAQQFLTFAAAMKAKDPSIVLLGCGTARDSLVPGWNRIVLETAGHAMDFITLHIYQGQNFFPIDAATPGSDRFKAIAAFSETARYLFEEIESIIQGREDLRHLKIAVTEWNTMYFPNPDMPNNHTLEAAVANACMLNEMIRQSHLVQIANFSDLVNGWVGGCIRVGDHYERMKKPGWSGKNDVIFGTATYHLLRLYANRNLHRVVQTRTQSGTFHAGPCKLPMECDSLPNVDTVACISETGDLLTVFVVNRTLEPTELVCDLGAWKPKEEVLLHTLTGEHYERYNTVFEPSLITAEAQRVRIDGSVWTYELRPHSVYVLEVPLQQSS